MTVPVSYYGQTIYDNTVKQNGQPEGGAWEVAITTLTAANYVAKSALLATLETAIAAIVIGNLGKKQTVIERDRVDDLPASTTAAQRENKWLLRYHSATTGQKYRVSLPTADLTLLPNHSEFMDLLTVASPGANLKAAFEAIVVDPDDESGVILDSVQFVGRNT